MRHLLAFVFALFLTTVLAHAELTQDADHPMTVAVSGSDSAILSQAIQKQLGSNATTSSYMSCSAQFDLSPAACTFSLAAGTRITGTEAALLLNIYDGAQKLIYENPKNHLVFGTDLIQLQKVDCSVGLTCSIEYGLPHPAGNPGSQIW